MNCDISKELNTSVINQESKLNNLKFDNKALRTLPIDSEKENYIRTVHNAIFSLVKPTPIKNPKLIAISKSALKLINLNENDVNDKFIQYFSGNELLNNSQTASSCYAGHQFGSFVGQLGDGAAIYLGEIINDENQRWEIQLKGAGLTPFSRGADGRKVLRSSIREFLCSEAMHYLDIPTTRSATCITSDDYVTRDIYYNGNEIKERCTVISRLAHSFIRFGHFEIFKTRDEYTGRCGPSVGNNLILEKLFDYVVETFFPKINKLNIENSDDQNLLRNLKCKEFFKEVVIRTARTVALWQTNGFIHGVLNTDNMSIIGLTLDYGPFAFLEKFNQFFISNGSDYNGRYSFINQPTICRWNLFKLAEMLQLLTPLDDLLNIQEQFYTSTYKEVYQSKMRSKFGLFNELKESLDDIVNDETLIDLFLDTLESTGSDLTNGFRNLNLIKNIYDEQLIDKQINNYIDLMINEEVNCLPYEDMKKESKELFQNINVQYCLQLKKESTDEQFNLLVKSSDKIKAFLQFINRYEKTKNLTKKEKLEWDKLKWKEFFEIYLKRIKYDLKTKLNDKNILDLRIKLMNSNNPKFILRNHLAQRAIEQAENGNLEEINRVIKLIERPFDDIEDMKDLERYYRMSRKEERCSITCSS